MTHPAPVSLGISDTVTRNVRAELARHNKTKTDLGRHLELGPDAIKNRLSGRKPFDVVEVASIARWLGVDITTLMPATTEAAS
jgi:hypothetical protein